MPANSRICEPTAKQQTEWKAWVASRPAAVRAIAERLDPWTLYRLKSTSQRVTLYSISENGTITVDVLGRFNAVIFERRVPGIDPNDLKPCELPALDEPVGSMLRQDEVDENIDALRVMVRPDLFVMDENGKARRKS
jgi:hypothetical protein